MISSAMPSQKYRWSFSRLMSVNGSAAIEAADSCSRGGGTAVAGGRASQASSSDWYVDLKDTQAVFKRGKVAVECPVKVEKASRKFETQAIRYAQRDGKNYLEEIRLGGTDLKLVVD
jgi:hypothetical protein